MEEYVFDKYGKFKMTFVEVGGGNKESEIGEEYIQPWDRTSLWGMRILKTKPRELDTAIHRIMDDISLDREKEDHQEGLGEGGYITHIQVEEEYFFENLIRNRKTS